jgi:hypothetical protein
MHSGIDDMLIQRVLRHDGVSTTQRNYIHELPEQPKLVN